MTDCLVSLSGFNCDSQRAFLRALDAFQQGLRGVNLS